MVCGLPLSLRNASGSPCPFSLLGEAMPGRRIVLAEAEAGGRRQSGHQSVAAVSKLMTHGLRLAALLAECLRLSVSIFFVRRGYAWPPDRFGRGGGRRPAAEWPSISGSSVKTHDAWFAACRSPCGMPPAFRVHFLC